MKLGEKARAGNTINSIKEFQLVDAENIVCGSSNNYKPSADIKVGFYR